VKKTIIILFIALIVWSCRKTTENEGGTPPPFKTYEIGDIFSNDTIRGIVFFTLQGGTNGLMVSLNDTVAEWCYPNFVLNETGATNANDGWNNTNILMSNFYLLDYPAMKWTFDKNWWYKAGNIRPKDWYMPSKRELGYLLQNQEAVNKTLVSLGYNTMEDKTFWTSTETGTITAAAGYIENGEVVVEARQKDNKFYVRAIRQF